MTKYNQLFKRQGGATEMAIHGRTKTDGYRADCINWQKIG